MAMTAEFRPAFDLMIELEGGHVLHEIKGDRGGQTYAGISRRHWPDWEGWKLIDSGEEENLAAAVRFFYSTEFWRPSGCALVEDQGKANCIFVFGVNAGVRTAVRLAQHVTGETADGVPGPLTLKAINEMDSEIFRLRYYVAMVGRYARIARKDRSQLKFLPGWLRRAERTIS